LNKRQGANCRQVFTICIHKRADGCSLQAVGRPCPAAFLTEEDIKHE